jgi:hypothetical protein
MLKTKNNEEAFYIYPSGGKIEKIGRFTTRNLDDWVVSKDEEGYKQRSRGKSQISKDKRMFKFIKLGAQWEPSGTPWRPEKQVGHTVPKVTMRY